MSFLKASCPDSEAAIPNWALCPASSQPGVLPEVEATFPNGHTPVPDHHTPVPRAARPAGFFPLINFHETLDTLHTLSM